jgi:hypothetical protein
MKNDQQILAIDTQLAKLSTLNCRYLPRRNSLEVALKASDNFADLKALQDYQDLLNAQINSLKMLAQEINAIIQY